MKFIYSILFILLLTSVVFSNRIEDSKLETYPQNGEIIKSNSTDIPVKIYLNGVKANKFKISINGQDITSQAFNVAGTIMLSGSLPLVFGQNSAEISYNDGAKTNSLKWNFTLEKDGERDQAPLSTTRKELSSYFFKVKILSPKEDEEVGLYFDIIGITKPNILVNIVPQPNLGGWERSFTQTTKSSLGANPGAIEVTSDEEGYFKIRFGFPIKIPIISVSYKFIVTAIDENGYRSLPAIFTVKVKKEIKDS